MAFQSQFLRLLYPLLVSATSMQVLPGDKDYWWTQPIKNFGFRPISIQTPWNNKQVTNNEDFNRYFQKTIRLTKRFDEAQILEALTSNDEAAMRSREEAERLRQLQEEALKILTRLKRTDSGAGKGYPWTVPSTRLKRTETEYGAGVGKEYITRLGKRSGIQGSFNRLFSGWKPLTLESSKDCNATQMMKKADKI